MFAAAVVVAIANDDGDDDKALPLDGSEADVTRAICR